MPELIIVFWQIFKSTWKIWVAIFIIALIPILVEYFFIWFKKWLDKRWLEKHKYLVEWKKLDPKRFEQITAIIFEKLGYKTKVIGGPKDRGIDIIAAKEGKRHFIQCKRMDKVIPDDVRAFWGSIQKQIEKGKGEGGVFVTTGSFTEESKEFVKDKPIELIDGLKLEELVKEKGVNFIFNKKSKN